MGSRCLPRALAIPVRSLNSELLWDWPAPLSGGNPLGTLPWGGAASLEGPGGWSQASLGFWPLLPRVLSAGQTKVPALIRPGFPCCERGNNCASSEGHWGGAGSGRSLGPRLPRGKHLRSSPDHDYYPLGALVADLGTTALEACLGPFPTCALPLVSFLTQGRLWRECEVSSQIFLGQESQTRLISFFIWDCCWL